tara:strand:+ start:651 stop:863 length:213 start_codon:yes stop_codon:yes gene_type:complete
MCVRRQKIPKIPPPRPIAPAPEKTAAILKIGENRKGRKSKISRSSGSGGRNTGVGSLRIPLKTGNLRIDY